MIPEEEGSNFDVFRDCLSTTIIQKLAPTTSGKKKRRRVKGRKREIKPVVKEEEGESGVGELGEFVEYLAEETFAALPGELRTLSYAAGQNDAGLLSKYAVPLDSGLLESLVKPLPLTVSDSLCSYGLIEQATDLERFLEPPISTYIEAVISPPAEYTPAITASRPNECEICEREQLPLTYHHLIPRQVHEKVIKRGWHQEWELNKVAWLCRACHSFVHKIASNEELAKELYSVELLLEREDVQKWAAWVSRVRWKAR